MFIKISNLTFMFFLGIRTVLIMSSRSWLFRWICLEVNLISLIPLLMYKIKFKSSSSSIKYFIIQAIASIILFISIINYLTNFNVTIFIDQTNLITIALAIKLGMPPFQFWVPQVIELVNIIKITLILVWQKIAPMVLICYSISNTLLVILMIRATIGSLGGLNQNNLKKIFFYSSLVHLSWILIILSLSERVWIVYLISYTLILLPLIIWCYIKKMNKANKINSSEINIYQKTLLIMRILSLAGLPPFLGFLIKILVLQLLIQNTIIIFTGIILTVASLISIFYYFKLSWITMLSTFSKNKLNLRMSLKKKLLFFFVLSANLGSPFMVFFI